MTRDEAIKARDALQFELDTMRFLMEKHGTTRQIRRSPAYREAMRKIAVAEREMERLNRMLDNGSL